MNLKLHSRLFAIISGLIFLAVALMIQPFDFDLFTYGFPLLLIGIVAFIVLDHVPTRASEGEESDEL